MIERIPSLVAVRSEKTDIYVLANKAREAILGIDWHDIVGKAVAKILPAALGQMREADTILRCYPLATNR